MTVTILPGIDGGNPLGWLAAVGVLTIAGGKLSWSRTESAWVPVLHHDDVSILDLLVERLGITQGPRITAVKRKGRPTSEAAAAPKNAVPFAYALDEPPCDDFMGNKIKLATSETIRTALNQCDAADVERIVAHASVTVREDDEPATTAVRDLVAGGQVRYLRTFREIVDRVRPEDIRQAIHGPWRYRVGPKTSLDPSCDLVNVGIEVTAIGAVSALGAERLALEGLRSLPTSPRGRYLMTRGFSRANRRERFRWFLWEPALTLDAIRVILGAPGLHSDSVADWAEDAGVSAVIESQKFRPSKQYSRLRRSQVLFERLGNGEAMQDRSN